MATTPLLYSVSRFPMLISPNFAKTAFRISSRAQKAMICEGQWSSWLSRFGAKKLLLEGGGAINGAFLKHMLIDEFSTLIFPAVDGVAGIQSIVDYNGAEGDRPGAGQSLRLTHCETLEGGMVWLRHAVERAPG